MHGGYIFLHWTKFNKINDFRFSAIKKICADKIDYIFLLLFFTPSENFIPVSTGLHGPSSRSTCYLH
jgi:hypothetical protein